MELWFNYYIIDAFIPSGKLDLIFFSSGNVSYSYSSLTGLPILLYPPSQKADLCKPEETCQSPYRCQLVGAKPAFSELSDSSVNKLIADVIILAHCVIRYIIVNVTLSSVVLYYLKRFFTLMLV